MAINIITGNTYRSVEEAIYADVARVNDKRSPIVVIVPDQYTQSIEVALLESLAIKCSFNIEIVSFSRLASKAVKTNRPMLNPQTGVMLLSRIIKDVENELTVYKGQSERTGFAMNVYAVITALRNSGITPSELKKRAINMMTGYMRSKFRDIYIIYNAFLRELSENYSDISMQLEEYVAAIPSLDNVANSRYYVVDFASMPKVKRSIVIELARKARDMTIGVAKGCQYGSNERLFSQDIKELISSLKELGGAVERDASEELSPTKKWVMDKLFSYSQDVIKDKPKGCNIHVARSRSEEVEWAAEDIKRKIVAGARFKDIAVVVPDLKAYAPIIKRHFDSFDHSYYIDDKAVLGGLPQIKSLRRAAELNKTGGRSKEWLNYIKDPLSGVSYDDATSCENYMRKYNINYVSLNAGSSVAVKDAWSMDYDRIVSHVRQTIAVLPSRGTSCTVEQLGHAIANYFTVTNADAQAASISPNITRKQGELINQATEKLKSIIEQAKTMFGDNVYNIDYLYNMIFTATDSLNISTAPIYADSIFVGDMATSRYNSLPHIYILGAEQDMYPTPIGDNGILADKEIKYLQDKNIYIEPTLIDRMHKGKFELVQLLMRWEESLTIVTPRSYDKAAEFVHQMSKILAIVPIFVTPDIVRADIDTMAIAHKIGTYKRAIRQRAIVEGRASEPVFGSPYLKHVADTVAATAVDEVSKRAELAYNIGDCRYVFNSGYVSISGIEGYYACPFKHYGSKLLKLKERQEKDVQASTLGSFIHRVLELYVEGVRSGDYSLAMTVEESSHIAGDIVAKVLAEKEFYVLNFVDNCGGYIARLTERVHYTMLQLNTMLQRSALRPLELEFMFGMGGGGEPLNIKTEIGDIKVRGIIDRIDADGENMAIIDYKSGNKKFSLKTIYYGETLQLIVYSMAAKLAIGREIIGLLYLSLPYKYSREEDSTQDEDKSYAYSGFVNVDHAVLAKLDSEYKNKDKTFLPLKFSTKKATLGEVEANDRSLDPYIMSKLENYATQLLAVAVENIAAGHIEPRHTGGACEYCTYGSLCKACDDKQYERQQNRVVANAPKSKAVKQAAADTDAPEAYVIADESKSERAVNTEVKSDGAIAEEGKVITENAASDDVGDMI